MAKQSDPIDTLINVSIFAAVAIAAWFVFKLVKNGLHLGDGSGGDGTLADHGDGTQPGTKPPTAAQKIADKYLKGITDPTKVDRMALELVAANIAAHQYFNKAGSNIVINKTLKAVNDLPDHEFMAVINKWLVYVGKPFFDTTLVGALIYTDAHGRFLQRYGELTGNTAMQHGSATKVAGKTVGAALRALY